MPIVPEHLAALSAYEALWQPADADTQIDAVFMPGFRDHRPGADGTDVSGFAEHRQAALGALSGLSAKYEPVAGQGQLLAAHATVRGVHTGEFLGVTATGKTLSWREVHLFEIRDGRIAGHWMDAALLSAYLQATGHGQPDAEPPRAVPSGLSRGYSTSEQRAPLDAYMAMISDRPHRVRRTHGEARAELVRCAGSQFDAKVVAAFLSTPLVRELELDHAVA